jgi:hypothetical protein
MVNYDAIEQVPGCSQVFRSSLHLLPNHLVLGPGQYLAS